MHLHLPAFVGCAPSCLSISCRSRNPCYLLLQDYEITEPVTWHVFGATHIARPEDFPVMPVETTGFMLKPVGFFANNPTLDVPPFTNKTSKLHTCCPTTDYVHANGNGLANGHANSNGLANGHANGHANGNGVANGHACGH